MKRYIILSVLALLSLSSCDKFLTEVPQDSLTDKNAFTSAADAEALVNSCYDGLQKGFEEYYTWYYLVISECLSDNAYSGGDDVDIINVFKRDITPLNLVVTKSWKSMYGGILRCNVVLSAIPEIDDPVLDEISFGEITRREEMLGEAAFLRALHYYNLVRLWGDVPLVTSTGSTEPEDVEVPRSPAEKIYGQILSDLEFASTRLPEGRATEAESRGLATLGAVWTLYAKTYAIMGAPDNVDWDSVRTYTEKVLASDRYSLLQEFDWLYDNQHRNNSETILAVQYEGNGSTEGNYVPAMLLPPSMTEQNWRKYLTPSQDLIAAFDEQGDEVRKNATIIYEDVNNMWYDEFYAVQENGSWSTRTIPFPYKSRGFDRVGWDCSDLIYIFRLADVVLLHAEALNHISGPETAAADPDLQMLRTRVGLEPLQTSSKDEMTELLLKERRLELAYEGERFNDLKRYGLLEKVLSEYSWEEIVFGEKVTKSRTFPHYMQYLPIPQDERDRNPELTQNEGY